MDYVTFSYVITPDVSFLESKTEKCVGLTYHYFFLFYTKLVTI